MVRVPRPSTVPVGSTGNPAQASLFLLEPTADAAMTYFYGQLFAMDSEIRAMFPAAMDLQRRRFFRALVRIARDQDDPAGARALPGAARARSPQVRGP